VAGGSGVISRIRWQRHRLVNGAPTFSGFMIARFSRAQKNAAARGNTDAAKKIRKARVKPALFGIGDCCVQFA